MPNITLCGSIDIISEFFEYCINSILFQRGVYEPEAFKMVKKYSINILVITNKAVQDYVAEMMTQVRKWLHNQSMKKLVIIIMSKDKEEVVERWQFDIRVQNPSYLEEKDTNRIRREMQNILRQLTSSLAYLPLIEVPCTFKVLAYTDKNAEIPGSWVETDPKLIKYKQQQMDFRNVSTPYHFVSASVNYRFRDY